MRAVLGPVLGQPEWRWMPPALIAAASPGPFPTDVFEHDGDVVIYWGELYNAKELASSGSPPPGDMPPGPAAIVWHLYRRDGAAMLERLNGQFALVAWFGRPRR
ncbi:MAG: hypothetical protein ACPMAQ_15960, partial [Phycisphaerae bacterium]